MSLSELKVGGRRRYMIPGTKAALEQLVRWIVSKMRPEDRPDLEAGTVTVRLGIDLHAPGIDKPGRTPRTSAIARWGSASSHRRVKAGRLPAFAIFFDYKGLCAPAAQIITLLVHELRHVRDHQEHTKMWYAGDKQTVRRQAQSQRMELLANNAQRRFDIDVPDSDKLRAWHTFFTTEMRAAMCPPATEIRLGPWMQQGGGFNFSRIPHEKREVIPPPKWLHLRVRAPEGTVKWVAFYRDKLAEELPKYDLMPDEYQPRWKARRDKYGTIKYTVYYPRDRGWDKARRYLP